MIINLYNIIAIALLVLASVIFGYMIGNHHSRKKPTRAGLFIINYDDPEKEFLGIKLDKGLPEIEGSQYITLEVVVEKE